MTKRPRRSTALVVHSGVKPEAKSKAHAEKLPEPEDLVVPAALLLAADAASASNNPECPWLQGVFLHVVDGKGRVVATDGSRMFLASFTIEDETPAWLADGVILSNGGLKTRVGMIAKGGEEPTVRLRWAKGLPKVEMSDPDRTMLFQVPVLAGTFPDYERAIPAQTFADLGDDGAPRGSEWEPIGINSVYLKQVGEIAKVLDAGLPKEARSKKGMVVRAYNGSGKPNVPLVFDFSTCPGAILVIMPARLSSRDTSPETAALLAPAARLTIAALRAHATRNLAWAEGTGDEGEKAAFTAKAEGFQKRIAEILKRVPGLPAIEGPATDEQTTSQEEAPAADDGAEAEAEARAAAEDEADAEVETEDARQEAMELAAE